ncbi:hypothetical protein ACWD0Z_19400 [Streptomyces sp. NPDC003007]
MSVLVAQHGMIKDLFNEVKSREGELKQRAFDASCGNSWLSTRPQKS